MVIVLGTLENGFLSVPIIFSKDFFCWVFINCVLHCGSAHVGVSLLAGGFPVLGSLKPSTVAHCKYVSHAIFL